MYKAYFIGVLSAGLLVILFYTCGVKPGNAPKDPNTKEASEDRPSRKLKDPNLEYLQAVTFNYSTDKDGKLVVRFKNPGRRKLMAVGFVAYYLDERGNKVGDIFHPTARTLSPKNYGVPGYITVTIPSNVIPSTWPGELDLKIISVVVDGQYVGADY